jgi:signal transduction histidine kinase
MNESGTYKQIAALAAGLAHEIKNPLSTISMNLQLLHEELEGIEEMTPRETRMHRRTGILLEESNRLTGILEKFLLFFRESESDMRPGNINHLLEGVLAFVEPEAKALAIQIRKHLDYSIPFFHFDFEQIRTAVLNLVKNAEAAMPDGGELMVQTFGDHEGVAVVITDTGLGIPADRLSDIFEIFYTTGEKGSGLGLPTVRRIAARHGGEVTVQSEPGKGSRFSLRIPFTPKEER